MGMLESDDIPLSVRLLLFAGAVTGSVIFAIYTNTITGFITRGKILSAIIVLSSGLIIYALYHVLMDRVSLPSEPLDSESVYTIRVFSLNSVVLVLAMILFFLLNFTILLVAITSFELLGIGATHADRITLITDLMAIFYGIIGIFLILYMFYMLYEWYPLD